MEEELIDIIVRSVRKRMPFQMLALLALTSCGAPEVGDTSPGDARTEQADGKAADLPELRVAAEDGTCKFSWRGMRLASANHLLDALKNDIRRLLDRVGVEDLPEDILTIRIVAADDVPWRCVGIADEAFREAGYRDASLESEQPGTGSRAPVILAHGHDLPDDDSRAPVPRPYVELTIEEGGRVRRNGSRLSRPALESYLRGVANMPVRPGLGLKVIAEARLSHVREVLDLVWRIQPPLAANDVEGVSKIRLFPAPPPPGSTGPWENSLAEIGVQRHFFYSLN